MEFDSTMIALICAAIVWLAGVGTKFLADTKKNMAEKVQNEKLQFYIDMLFDNTATIVQSLNQTIVDDLKKASADGKLTSSEANSVKNNAMNLILDTLSDDAKEILSLGYTDLNTFVGNLIDATVRDLKDNITDSK